MKAIPSGKKVAFLFGAGAEYGMGLPTGAQYTEQTMLHKNSELYKALEQFYEPRTTDEYSGKHRKDFLFSTPKSHTFLEIVKRAAKSVSEEYSDKTKIDEATQRVVDAYNIYAEAVKEHEQKIGTKEQVEIAESKLKILAEKVYSEIIEKDIKVRDCSKDYRTLRKHFSYYGSVEKDFSSIICPKDAGTITFWRLINYFWTAYFAIVCPLLGIKDPKKQNYQELLSNLLGTIEKIYCKNTIDNFIQGSYYDALHNAYPNSVAITTNYTPFVEHVWGAGNAVYLAGRLSQMEDPTTFEILDLQEKGQNIESRFLFPYMMTQALVKPIIGPEQIDEYSRFSDCLSKADTLVIVGYSLGSADNHINSFIRKFLKNGGRLIYCAYKDSKRVTENQRRKEVLNALHLSNTENFAGALEVFCYGKSEELMTGLDQCLQGSTLNFCSV